MQIPLKLAFRGVEPSPAIEAQVRERAQRLERFYDRITSCEVVFDSPHRHHHKGRLYTVHVLLRIPGAPDIAVNRAGPQDHAHEDPYVALRDAFDAAARMLEDTERRRDHRGRSHVSRRGRQPAQRGLR